MRATGSRSRIRAFALIIILALAMSLVSVTVLPSIVPDLGDTHPGGATIPTSSSAPVRSDQAAVEGWVLDSHGSPVQNALVTVGSVKALSDISGHFTFSKSAIGGLPDSLMTQLDVRISHAGYAPWSITGVRYYPLDTVRLYPRLDESTRTATHLSAAQPRYGDASVLTSFAPAQFLSVGVPNLGSGALAELAAQAQSAPLAVPSQIRVYRTATGTVDVIPFKEYVKHVLPNEWIPTWPQASLQAGAMAVKEYAWYWIARGGKQGTLGADVKDNTDDQVYDPDVSYASTDAAVDATWQYAMTQGGALFQASYCAGSYQADPSADCPWNGNYMTQWGTKYYADQGKSWSWITRFYYRGTTISPNPPGGDGGPVPTLPPAVNPPPAPGPVGATFTVGQGATNPQVFQDAYDRNGGVGVLGKPTGMVRWWLQYISENNVLAQPFAGANGQGTMWLVFDTLKNDLSGVNRAYLLSGDIANAYENHTPPGPEWIGAPTSDPYIAGAASSGLPSQGFTRGALTAHGQDVQFTPWPTQFSGWEADYFAGKLPAPIQLNPTLDFPGQPSNIADVPEPDMSWPIEERVPEGLGLGSEDWSAQFTKVLQLDPGSYDFILTADSGIRLWVDGLLAVNAWSATGAHTEHYNADLDGTPHTIRIQYFSASSAAQLTFSLNKRGVQTPVPAPPSQPNPPAGQPQPPSADNSGSLRISVNWLGRSPAPGDSWAQPLTLLLSVPGDPTLIHTYQGSTDRNGVAIFSNLPAGTFDVHVKGAHSLQSARASISIPPNSTADVDMKAQLEGDLDGDNCVTINDFALVQAMVGTDKNTPGFDPRADLNGDGQVTLTDVSLLRSGFDRCGDISADNDMQALSIDGSADMSQALAPWLNPGALQKNLSLSLVPGVTTIGVGNIVEVAVVANAGSQAIDGGSFLLHYDPSVLSPVDSSGNPAPISEPGLALPSVLTNWVDGKRGSIGYTAAMLQGDAPSGQVVLTVLNFRALRPGPTALTFAPLSSGYMQLSNGGENLLANASDLTLSITP